MSSINRSLSRRRFLRSGAAVTAAGSLGGFGGVLAAQEENRNRGSAEDPFQALKEAPTPLIMDALIRLGYERTSLAMSRGIRPMIPARGTIVGPAVTTKYEESSLPTTRDDIRSYVFRSVDEAEPGSIWVTASGTREVLSMFGDVIVLACRQQGLAGLVTDGGCRDIEGMEEVGLPVYAAGTCLYGPGSVIRPVAANVPVVCGGIEITPGDVVAADVNGVMAFPSEALPDVIQKIGDLGEKESRSRRAIEQGQSLETAYEF
ncbi:MAG: hypothetical protein OXG98_11580 [Gemmatimonadetes bacterium]|nr:hypothetical protein [Gemmatimonadota bacterium]